MKTFAIRAFLSLLFGATTSNALAQFVIEIPKATEIFKVTIAKFDGTEGRDPEGKLRFFVQEGKYSTYGSKGQALGTHAAAAGHLKDLVQMLNLAFTDKACQVTMNIHRDGTIEKVRIDGCDPLASAEPGDSDRL